MINIMKETALKTTAAAIGAAFISYLGALAAPLLVLLVMMLTDYATGLIKAYVTAQISSRTGFRGILKKVCYMALVAVGAAVDYLLSGALSGVGITLQVPMFCALLVAVWLIINELISILENLSAIGVPGFPWLTKLLLRLKSSVENTEVTK